MSPAAAELLLLISLVTMVVAGLWRSGVGMVYDARIAARQREIDVLSKTVADTAAEATRLEQDYAALRPQTDRLRRDLMTIKRKSAELARERYAVMQQLGVPGDERRCFLFELFFTPMDGRGGRAPFDPRFWQHRNFIEVWAGSAPAADRQLGITFESKSGYRRSGVIEERHAGAPRRPVPGRAASRGVVIPGDGTLDRGGAG